jgi:branched-chain amino acid aminotransferase
VIALLTTMGVEMRERPISTDEVAQAHAAGRLRECFGTGTAATISHHRDRLPGQDLDPAAGSRPAIAPAVPARMTALHTGREPDPSAG